MAKSPALAKYDFNKDAATRISRRIRTFPRQALVTLASSI